MSQVPPAPLESRPRFGALIVSAILLGLLLPGSALAAGATRTWVSGVGDDANPCSREAPCKTWAGAIAKTETGGEVDALDAGGFGAVTITKAITLSATGVTAGLLVAGTNGITVDTAPGELVVLHGLDFQGLGAGLSAVEVESAGSVRLEDSTISGFDIAGVDFRPSSANTTLVVEDTQIRGLTGDGIIAEPQGAGGGSVDLIGDEIGESACGVVAASYGLQASPSFATECGTSSSGEAHAAKIASWDTSITNTSGAGILSNGPSATNVISNDVLTGNGIGLEALRGGLIEDLGESQVFGNAIEGSPTSTAVSDLRTGPTGATGATGPQGSAGPAGAAGPKGAPGQVELLTCKTVTVLVKADGKRRKLQRQQCTGKLVSGTVKLTTTGAAAKASLARAGKVFATGSASYTGAGARLRLRLRRPLTAGSYALTLTSAHRTLARMTVSLG
jgi:hypothetical protein